MKWLKSFHELPEWNELLEVFYEKEFKTGDTAQSTIAQGLLNIHPQFPSPAASPIQSQVINE